MLKNLETGLACGIAIAISALAGCGGSGSSGGSSTGGGTTTPPAGALVSGGAASAYVVQNPMSGTGSILQFTAKANGAMTPTNTLTAPANFKVVAIALDANGQIYVGGDLSGQDEVLAYAAGSTGTATPTRSILYPNTMADSLESLTVDSSGNLYVVGFGGKISVYSATATGAATPTRVISGTLSTLSNYYLYSMALDSAGNIYVAGGLGNGVGGPGGAILEFSPTANGNVAPMRTITSSTLAFFGIAVDAAGNVYAAEDDFSKYTAPAVIAEFSSTASGAATPTKTITLTGTTASDVLEMRVDAVGNLYAVLATQVGTGTTATATYSVVAVGPTATGTMAPAAQMTSTAWSSPGPALAIR